MNETCLTVETAVEAPVILPFNDDILLDQIAEALCTDGYIILPSVMSNDMTSELLNYLSNLDDNRLKRAGIGREGEQHVNDLIRSDEIMWLDKRQPEAERYFSWIEKLRTGINRRLFLGLFEYECHFARFQSGAFYKKHLDSFRGARSRVVTSIMYLNRDWLPEHGGELVMYAPESEEVIARVAPSFGTLVVFLSEEFPHEVLPTTCERLSLTGWFRVNASDQISVDPAR